MEIDFSEKYHMTLFVVATENLVMAATLLLKYVWGKQKDAHYQPGIALLSVAMLLMTLINYAEYFMPVDDSFLPYSMSIVILAASLELFLMLYTFVTLLDKDFLTGKRLAVEICFILLLCVPPLFLPSDTFAFRLLFNLSVLFYLSKYIYNFYIYTKCFRQAQAGLFNYYSEERGSLIRWMNGVFYLVSIIGAVSVVVPLTNYMVLTFYNLFLFFAYFYIYIEVILHEPLFNGDERILSGSRKTGPEVLFEAGREADIMKSQAGFMAGRETLFNQWITGRAYARQGITIEDVARELNTNRTTLSIYLNSELRLNFYDWISLLRVEEAKKQLVENPTMPIVEIATEIGIDDRSNFDKIFKRVVGMSPATYRKLHLQA